jgi:hypothetical protein
MTTALFANLSVLAAGVRANAGKLSSTGLGRPLNWVLHFTPETAQSSDLGHRKGVE